MEAAKRVQYRCVYCGRYFRADNRVGERQKSCGDKECRAKRKRESQRRWVEANPGYFRGLKASSVGIRNVYLLHNARSIA